ncbi:hypothetical protein [Corallococcus llansteffanensis]|uniref:Uncharacterized protein n=1 Tax=Corallococcus llansteffanensis TaxID=2316731 RepID=A0A3A8QFE7_9BACT|nr:hypothetical protein [Corallococcus llansteffanensis]RKH66688.1 hypothetical protein D7V93_04110 [Corallococcus llansteffanensis]
MKYQCEACERLVPVESFRVEDGVLTVTCRACGARTLAQSSPAPALSNEVPREGGGGRGGSEGVAVAVPTPESFASAPPVPSRVSVTALRVVRSDAPSAEAPALDGDPFQAPPGHCPKCVAPKREEDGACAQCGLVYANFLPDEHLPSGVLATEWRALLQTWDDDEAHDRLVTLAVGRGELAMAGRLYRLRLARAPGDVKALRGRDEVVRRVTSVVPLASDGPSPELARKVKSMVMGAVLLVALMLVVLLFQLLRGSF